MRENILEEPTLIVNDYDHTIYDELIDSLKHCKMFYFSVAFINYSGLQLLLDMLSELDDSGVKGKIIASTYLNFTDIKSLKKLHQFKNIETKVYITDNYKGFHTKGYIFEFEDYYKIIIGSSNITQSALKSNIEWNVKYQTKKLDNNYAIDVIKQFNILWEQTTHLNNNFIEQYEDFLNDMKDFIKYEKEIFSHKVEIKENPMQKQALENLKNLRINNQHKALIIAATGTGKTYLSAFDVKQMNAKRVLFLVHREVILKDAKESFEHILPEYTTTIYQGKNKHLDSDITFAMIPSLSRDENYKQFAKDHFDYIIADEAHRSYSDSYQTLLNYFNPKFMLGMTATPERTDHGNIFKLFENNIALEIRLRDALKEDLVIPFHYFGITDVTADLSNVDVSKIDEVAQKLSINKRVEFIIEKMEHYGFSGEKRKCLAFCVNKNHAEYMAKEFNAFGYSSVALTGESSDQQRAEAIKNLEDPHHTLEFIFTIDIFNEGVDIPSANLVLMLRPTQSPIIFTQQLGRGLRKHHEKDFLTVLDFIGNHKKTFLIPIALSGSRYYDKDSLKVQVYNDFSDIPGCSNIQMDKFTKEKILQQLDQVNLNNMAFLKDEYLEFKKVLNGNIPSLTDYALFDSAPDPTKFIVKTNSYVEFIDKVEKNQRSLNQTKRSVLRTIDKELPIKRINEFVIFKYIFEKGSLSYKTALNEILKVVHDVDETSLKHSFKYLSGEILGPNEKDPFPFIDGDQKQLFLKEKSLMMDTHIIDSLSYGILRFQEEFGKSKMNYPYLKLYQPYKMKDMGYLTNYEKSFSSIRGTGVWRNGDHFYLFVDLHKGEDIKESIDYKDKLLSRNMMQWETQNITTQSSKTGQDLCFNQQRGIKMHMFLRKAKKIGTQNLDYIYVGEVNTRSFDGNKPITMQLEFEKPLPQYLYDDLTLEI